MRRIGEQALTFRTPAVVDGELTYIDPDEFLRQWVVLSFGRALANPTGSSGMSRERTWKSMERRCCWFRWRRSRSTLNGPFVADECISPLWEIHSGGYSVFMVVRPLIPHGGLERF